MSGLSRRSVLALAAGFTFGPTRTVGLSVRDMGGVGDGRHHPLSELFPTLEQARKHFPRALSLNQERDATAAQAAIDRLAASPYGGTVVFPPGRYRMDAELVLPALTDGDDAFSAVELAGAGLRSSVLHWPADLGAGRSALRLDPPYQRTSVRDLTVLGPRLRDELGQAPAEMDGIAVTSRAVLSRVGVAWFRAGVAIRRDHSTLHDCEIAKNLYGLYWAGGEDSFGDHTVTGTDLAGNKLASIAIAPDNGIDHATFLSCHMGFAPFGLIGEGGLRTRTVLSNTKMIDCAFEACGNGWIDAGPGGWLHGNVFLGCSFSQIADYTLPGRSYAAIIRAEGLDRNLFQGGTATFGEGGPDPTEAAIVTRDLIDNRFENARRLLAYARPVKVTGTERGNTFLPL